MTNATRRRKSPLTGRYVTIPVELVPSYEIYQKVAKRLRRPRMNNNRLLGEKP